MSYSKLLLALVIVTADAFIPHIGAVSKWGCRPAVTCATTSAEPPTWEELERLVPPLPSVQPKLTLFRDTNGWCPFCERVWVALRLKGIPYDEVLVNLQDKPQWYLDMVPSGQVPAVELHDEQYRAGQPGTSAQGLIPESANILTLLDESFPGAVTLATGSPSETAALAAAEALLSSSFAYSYSARNASLSEDEKAGRKATFMMGLRDVEALLSTGEGSGGHGGPFLAGAHVSYVDLMAIPMLERYRYQLQFLAGADAPQLYDHAAFPGLAGWYDAMDGLEAFSGRVAGDAYSWLAVTSTFLRLFAKDSTPLDVLAAADAAAEAALLQAADPAATAGGGGAGLSSAAADTATNANAAALEAARKLVANHAAIVKDATKADPQSQKHLPRVATAGSDFGGDFGGATSVDTVLRATAASLLRRSEGPGAGGAAGTELAVELVHPADSTAKAAARYVASRLCAPRDMSAPAAALLRTSLMATATAEIAT